MYNERMIYDDWYEAMEKVFDEGHERNYGNWYAYKAVIEQHGSIIRAMKKINEDGRFKPWNCRDWLMGADTTPHQANAVWDRFPVKWRCPHNHIFSSTLSKVHTAVIKETPVRELCGYCSRNMDRMDTLMYRDQRLTLSLICDERSERLIVSEYNSGNKSAQIEMLTPSASPDVIIDAQLNNYHKSYRPKVRQKHKQVHVACDDVYAFVWAGPIAPDKMSNPLTGELIKNSYDGPYYPEDIDGVRGTRGMAGIENAIEELIEDGYKVLNVMWNPQYIRPGVYEFEDFTTTNAALADYLKRLEAEWLDWQQQRMLTPKTSPES